ILGDCPEKADQSFCRNDGRDPAPKTIGMGLALTALTRHRRWRLHDGAGRNRDGLHIATDTTGIKLSTRTKVETLMDEAATFTLPSWDDRSYLRLHNEASG